MTIRARIIRDSDAFSPREDGDNLGVMATWHRQYSIGEVQPDQDPPQYADGLPEGTVILPLYMYDHSGLAFSTEPFGCNWDSGQLGFIYATPDRIRSWFGVKEITPEVVENVKKCLRSEVEVYDTWQRGDVYGYVIESKVECDSCHHHEWEHVDSCWGFYGFDSMLEDMREHVEDEYHPALESAFEDTSSWEY